MQLVGAGGRQGKGAQGNNLAGSPSLLPSLPSRGAESPGSADPRGSHGTLAWMPAQVLGAL